MDDIGIKLTCEESKQLTIQDVLKMHHEKIGYLLREFSKFVDDVIRMSKETEKANCELKELLKEIKKDLKKEQNK